MSELRINNITDRAGSSGPIIAGVSTVTSTSHMVMPSGPSEMRGGRGRGIIAGGYANPSFLNSMEFIQISTTGNSTDFGDMSEAKRNLTGASSSIRGIIFGGQTPSSPNVPEISIEYVTISSSGGGNDFGDLLTNHHDGAGVTSEIRGFVCGGGNTYQNVIDFVTIASTGDSTDFGDLAEFGRQLNAGCESPTRGIILGGYNGAPHPSPSSVTSTIQFFNFASRGNTTKFGELTEKARNVIAVSDQTRGVRMGGYSETANPAAFTNTIDFITMASEGNATDFGDCLSALLNGAPAQNKTRGVMMGGSTPTYTNTIQFITIQSAGNATDFGDLLAAIASVPAGLCDINASNSG